MTIDAAHTATTHKRVTTSGKQFFKENKTNTTLFVR
jgi:hypothetical protein